jgi:hypothetical protein
VCLNLKASGPVLWAGVGGSGRSCHQCRTRSRAKAATKAGRRGECARPCGREQATNGLEQPKQCFSQHGAKQGAAWTARGPCTHVPSSWAVDWGGVHPARSHTAADFHVAPNSHDVAASRAALSHSAVSPPDRRACLPRWTKATAWHEHLWPRDGHPATSRSLAFVAPSEAIKEVYTVSPSPAKCGGPADRALGGASGPKTNHPRASHVRLPPLYSARGAVLMVTWKVGFRILKPLG